MDKIDLISKSQRKGDFATIVPGATVKVYQRVKEGEKTRTQIFEGVVIARKHGSGISSTVTVRRVVDGIGIERIFPLHAPTIEKITAVRQGKVRRAKLYYLRHRSRKSARMKEVAIAAVSVEAETAPKKPEKEEAAA
ncbi:MAG: 50S ribosomal protein L19 [bacterium]|nr:50S ribosomal protein L19 [bacterium]